MDDVPGNRDIDERRIARAIAVGIPVATVIAASVAGIVQNAATAILVLTGGALLGVIGLFWASLRVLSGDAPLAPELLALEASTHGVDALASQKQMLLRALKDLESEHALGKLESDDYAQLSARYRTELKSVLARIDESLAPHRREAAAAAADYLAKHGAKRAERGDDADAKGDAEASSDDAAPDSLDRDRLGLRRTQERRRCGDCGTSNDLDASFCKKCGESLRTTPTDSSPRNEDGEDGEDEDGEDEDGAPRGARATTDGGEDE